MSRSNSAGIGLAATYTPDGDGNRVGQTVNGATSTFDLDLSGALPSVLADGVRRYLPGDPARASRRRAPGRAPCATSSAHRCRACPTPARRRTRSAGTRTAAYALARPPPAPSASRASGATPAGCSTCGRGRTTPPWGASSARTASAASRPCPPRPTATPTARATRSGSGTPRGTPSTTSSPPSRTTPAWPPA
jgi:hypothetical protein